MTSQPALPALIAAFANTERDTGLDLAAVNGLGPYWESVRRLYRPFEAGLSSPTGAVYRHEIPGGQLSNLRQQAIAMGLGDRFELIEEMYAACDELLGRVIKVTPTSKVVGDMALHLVGAGLTTDDVRKSPESVDLPDSVIGFLHGELGQPPGGFPEPLRTDVLKGRRPPMSPTELTDEQLARLDDPATTRNTLSELLFPKPYASLVEHLSTYGELFRLPTRLFWYGMGVGDHDVQIGLGKGVQLLAGLEAIGEPDDRGMRRVVFRLNGQLRPLDVLDTSAESRLVAAEKADPSNPAHVAAPFTGVVSTKVSVGDTVSVNGAVAVIEAMKMESVISAPIAGTVERIAIDEVASVEPGDLLLVIKPA